MPAPPSRITTCVYIPGWAERYADFKRSSLLHHHRERVERLCKIALRLIYPRNKWLTYLGIDILGVQTTRQLLGFPQNKEIKHLLDCFDPDCTIEPEKPLKIAVCLSGETRTMDHCLPSQQRFFHGHEVDYFCHLWEDDKIPESLSSLKNSYLNIDKRPSFDELEVTSLKDYGLKYINKGLKNSMVDLHFFPMWYGVRRAYQTIEESGKNPKDYDLICRSRYDALLVGCLGLFKKMPEANQIAFDCVYNIGGGWSDQWAIGRPDEMSKYCHLFDWFLSREYTGSCMSERIFKHYLAEICKLEAVYKNLGLHLLRSDFIGLPPHKIPSVTHHFDWKKFIAQNNYIEEKYPDIYVWQPIKFRPGGYRLLRLLGIRYHR